MSAIVSANPNYVLKLPRSLDVMEELLHSLSQPLTSLQCSLELSLEHFLEYSLEHFSHPAQSFPRNPLAALTR